MALEAAQSLYNFIGLVAGHQKLQQDAISVQITQHTLNTLIEQFKTAKNQGDYTALTNITKMLVDFSRGFKSRVESQQVIDTFSGVLSEICQLMKMQGVASVTALQEQIIKYIETNVTILGAVLKPLIIEATFMQAQ